jgi:hypothetical protein
MRFYEKKQKEKAVPEESNHFFKLGVISKSGDKEDRRLCFLSRKRRIERWGSPRKAPRLPATAC